MTTDDYGLTFVKEKLSIFSQGSSAGDLLKVQYHLDQEFLFYEKQLFCHIPIQHI